MNSKNINPFQSRHLFRPADNSLSSCHSLKINTWIVLAICLIIVLMYFYAIVYDSRRNLNGIWRATTRFCKKAEISSMILQLRDADDRMDSSGALPTKGHLVIISGDEILSNQELVINGWRLFKQTHPFYKEQVRAKCKEEQIIPETLTLEINKKGVLLLKGKKELFGEFQKI